MDYAEALRSCTENGADPEILFGAADEIEQLRPPERKQEMSIEIPEPDMDVLRRLYGFGGLLVYRVAYFDPVLFKVTNGRVTFSEEAAQAELDGLKRAGFTAGMESFIVKFDGAFSKRPNVEHNRRPQGVRVDGPVGPHGSTDD